MVRLEFKFDLLLSLVQVEVETEMRVGMHSLGRGFNVGILDQGEIVKRISSRGMSYMVGQSF